MTQVVKQGTDFEIRVPNVRDANGVLVTNWTGFTVKSQVRERPESPTVLHEWSTTVGTVTFSGSDIVMSTAAATSTGWTWTHGRFDVELISPTGKTVRIAEDHIIVSRESTR